MRVECFVRGKCFAVQLTKIHPLTAQLWTEVRGVGGVKQFKNLVDKIKHFKFSEQIETDW